MGATLCCGAWASHCRGFSCGAGPLGTWVSVAAPHGLGICGPQAQLLHDIQDPPGPGIEPVSPALAGGFPTTGPPRKSLNFHSFEARKYFLENLGLAVHLKLCGPGYRVLHVLPGWYSEIGLHSS